MTGVNILGNKKISILWDFVMKMERRAGLSLAECIRLINRLNEAGRIYSFLLTTDEY